jgi:hypothetical protein
LSLAVDNSLDGIDPEDPWGACSLDNPGQIEPKLEMFTKRRLKWVAPLDLPQFEGMPG